MLHLTKTVFFLAKLLLVIAKVSKKEYAALPDLFLLDNYDRCTLYREKFLYCIVDFQLFPLNPSNTSIVWQNIEELTSIPANYRHDLLKQGVCIPDLSFSITNDSYQNQNKLQYQLTDYYNQKYSDKGLRVVVKSMTCANEVPNTKGISYTIFIIFVIVYVSVLSIITLLDLLSSQNEKKSGDTLVEKIICALSIRKNWQRLMTVNLTTKDMKNLSFLQGIRVYCIVLVLGIHFVAKIIEGLQSNTYSLEKQMEQGFVLDLSYLMHFFFVITMFLLYHQIFRIHERGQKLTVKLYLKLLIKRYIRLTPVLAITYAFTMILLIHGQRGPLWDNPVKFWYKVCLENGWMHFLYINNFAKNMCFRHTWYSAVNFQLYALLLPLAYLMVKYSKWAIHICTSLLILHVAYMFLVFNRHSYPIGHTISLKKLLVQGHNAFQEPPFFLHISVYANAAAAVTGLLVGHVYHKTKNKIFITKKIHFVIWSILASFSMIMVYIDNCLTSNNNQLFVLLYLSSKRVLFSLSVGILFIGIVQGQGRLLKWMCDNKPIYILGRLTYGVYIFHFIMQNISNLRFRSPKFVYNLAFLYDVISDVSLSFLISIILTLFVEMPMNELFNICTYFKDETVPRKKNL